MWIRTQDQKKIINIVELQIKPSYKIRYPKYSIIGTCGKVPMYKVKLASYNTIEETVIVLNDIQYHINSNQNTVYQMK